jgi:hypothetical protein
MRSRYEPRCHPVAESVCASYFTVIPPCATFNTVATRSVVREVGEHWDTDACERMGELVCIGVRRIDRCSVMTCTIAAVVWRRMDEVDDRWITVDVEWMREGVID